MHICTQSQPLINLVALNSHKQLSFQDNVIRDRSLDAIRLYNPNLGDPNSNQENADATLAVDAIQTAVCAYIIRFILPGAQ